MSPGLVVFVRCFFGAVMLTIIMIIRKEKLNVERKSIATIVSLALINNVIPWMSIAKSETIISSGLASILNATTPIWTLIIGFLLFSSTLRKNQWLGIGIGFIGIFILSDLTIEDMLSGNTVGVLYMILAAVCYGTGAHLTKRILNNLSVLQLSFYSMWVSTLVSFLFVTATDFRSFDTIFSVEYVVPFIGIGALGSGIAYLLFFYLVKEGSPEFAALVTYLVPITAVLWGAVWLGEQVNLTMILGLIIILSGIYISSFKTSARKRRETAA